MLQSLTLETVTFSAATVLFAASICSLPGVEMPITEDEFFTSWDKAILILEYHKGRIQSAEVAIQVLRALREKTRRLDSASDPVVRIEGTFFEFYLE